MPRRHKANMTATRLISQKKLAALVGLAGAMLALATGAMAAAPPEGPARMSGLHVEGLAGYPALDRFGVAFGQVIRVETDYKGRTRYVRIALDEGGEVRVASFNAWLDGDHVRTEVAADLLSARSSANEAS